MSGLVAVAVGSLSTLAVLWIAALARERGDLPSLNRFGDLVRCRGSSGQSGS